MRTSYQFFRHPLGGNLISPAANYQAAVRAELVRVREKASNVKKMDRWLLKINTRESKRGEPSDKKEEECPSEASRLQTDDEPSTSTTQRGLMLTAKTKGL